MFQGMPYFHLKYGFFTAAGSALLRFILTERDKKNLWSIGPLLRLHTLCTQTAFPGCFWILTNDYIIQFLGSTSSAQAILYLKTDIWTQILLSSGTWSRIMWIRILVCSSSDNSKRSEQTPVNDRLDKSSDSVNSDAWWKPVYMMYALNPFVQCRKLAQNLVASLVHEKCWWSWIG